MNPFKNLETLSIFLSNADATGEAMFDLETYGIWPLKYCNNVLFHISISNNLTPRNVYYFIKSLLETILLDVEYRKSIMGRIDIFMTLPLSSSPYYGNIMKVFNNFNFILAISTKVYVNNFEMGEVLRSMNTFVTSLNTITGLEAQDALLFDGTENEEDQNEEDFEMSDAGTDIIELEESDEDLESAELSDIEMED